MDSTELYAYKKGNLLKAMDRAGADYVPTIVAASCSAVWNATGQPWPRQQSVSPGSPAFMSMVAASATASSRTAVPSMPWPAYGP